VNGSGDSNSSSNTGRKDKPITARQTVQMLHDDGYTESKEAAEDTQTETQGE